MFVRCALSSKRVKASRWWPGYPAWAGRWGIRLMREYSGPGDGRGLVVIVEYWLASYLGRAWLWLHKDLRPKLGELPGLCTMVAHRNSLGAGQLWRAQDFAVRVW